MSLPPPPFDLSPTFLNQPTPLEKAGQIVSKVLESDGQFPDLADLLKGSTSERYSNRVSPINEQDFVKYGAVYIPQRVADDIDQMACRCFMGILPEINRAWVTVDHRLFLWNYTDGSDVYIYDDQDQIICSVGLAKPKPGVFNDYISHILIIATPLSISIIGVAIQPRQKTQQLMLDAETLSKDSTSGTLALYATDLVVPSDGVQMSKIVSTDEGRIFMVGDDGRLYELEYHQPNSWFMKKCRLVPRTAKILSNYVPSFLKPKGSEIKSVAIDNERKVMYLLSNASTIEVIYLGPKGDFFATVARNTDIGNAARLACRQNSVLMEASDFELESIHVISKAESKKVHLVAITTTGYRLYFSHHKDVLRMTFLSPTPDAPPNALELVHVRLPPPVEASGPGLAMQGQQRQNGNIRATYYGCGTLLAAKIVTEESDTLLTIATDYGEYANPRPPQNMTSGTMAQNSGLVETASTIDIEGKMLDIAEIPHRQGRRNMNEICEQLRDPCRQFIILTEKGLTFVRKQRPVDILLEMLRVTHGDVDANQPDFIAFFERYGQAQTCAMCLDIICANFGATSPELVDVIQGATKLFFDYGGSPVPSRTEMSTSGNHLGRTPGQPTTIYSGKHDGFALYFARLVSSVWKLQVLQCSPDAKTNGDLRQYQSMLLAAQRKLSWLKKFMDANEDFHSVANIADARQHTSDQTMLRIFVNEQQSLHGLYVLLSQCIEAISFLDFLIDASIPEIMQCVPEKLRSEMSNLSLELMLSTDQGRALTRELVLAAIEKYGKTDMYVGFDVVSAVLQQKCSCFFGPSDVAFYKGIENLKRASLAASEGERKTALAESLSQFKDAAHTLSDEKLYDVCRSYCDLAFHAGAVELCVVSAQKIDPHEEALAFVENRTNFGDPRPGQLYQLRRRCYQLALAVLKTTRTLAGGHQIFPGIGDPRVYAAQVLSVALAQKDRLFHYTLYEWMIKEGRKAELLNVDNTTYLIPYFKTYVDEVESKDFLWQYYRRHGRYYEAALYLESLATQPSNINLEKRIEFLSLAIINARCRDPNCQELQESTQLLQSLEQKIGVARIQLRLKRILKSKGPEGEAAAQVLDGQLLDLNALFHDFARRFQLEDMTLVIKEFADNPDLK